MDGTGSHHHDEYLDVLLWSFLGERHDGSRLFTQVMTGGLGAQKQIGPKMVGSLKVRNWFCRDDGLVVSE
jgi:hypothetical protein